MRKNDSVAPSYSQALMRMLVATVKTGTTPPLQKIVPPVCQRGADARHS